MKKILFIIVLIFLGGCQGNKTLDRPINLRLEEDVVLWDAVEDAEAYVIYINYQAFLIETTQYDFSQYENGTYKVNIKAIADGYKDSFLSDEIVVVINRVYPIPQNITIEDGMISWDVIDQAIHYVISISGESLIVNATSFDLKVLPENMVYEIRVKAIYPNNKESLFSSVIRFHTYLNFVDVYEEVFLKSSEDDIELDLSDYLLQILKIKDETNTEIDTNAYVVEENIIKIKNEYLQDLPYGEAMLFVETTLGDVLFQIQIGDDRKPKLLSSNLITFEECVDIELDFELYNGRIVSVFGNDITEDDYMIVDNRIMIANAFVGHKFNTEPQRTRLILGYYLEANDHMVVSYIFIDRPSG